MKNQVKVMICILSLILLIGIISFDSKAAECGSCERNGKTWVWQGQSCPGNVDGRSYCGYDYGGYYYGNYWYWCKYSKPVNDGQNCGGPYCSGSYPGWRLEVRCSGGSCSNVQWLNYCSYGCSNGQCNSQPACECSGTGCRPGVNGQKCDGCKWSQSNCGECGRCCDDGSRSCDATNPSCGQTTSGRYRNNCGGDFGACSKTGSACLKSNGQACSNGFECSSQHCAYKPDGSAACKDSVSAPKCMYQDGNTAGLGDYACYNNGRVRCYYNPQGRFALWTADNCASGQVCASGICQNIEWKDATSCQGIAGCDKENPGAKTQQNQIGGARTVSCQISVQKCQSGYECLNNHCVSQQAIEQKRLGFGANALGKR